MSFLVQSALGTKMLLEVVALVAIGIGTYFIFDSPIMSWVAALTGPLALALIWAIFVAPRSEQRLDVPWRVMLELAVFALAAAALWFAASPAMAGIFSVVALVDTIVLLAAGQYRSSSENRPCHRQRGNGLRAVARVGSGGLS